MRELRDIEKMVIANIISESLNGCFSVDECAKFLGKHRATVIRHCGDGAIKSIQVDRGYSIPKFQFYQDVIDSIEERTGLNFNDASTTNVVQLEQLKELKELLIKMNIAS